MARESAETLFSRFVSHESLCCGSGGAAVTGTCFGLSFLLAALAAATTALGFLLGIIAVIWLLTVTGKSGSGKAGVHEIVRGFLGRGSAPTAGFHRTILPGGRTCQRKDQVFQPPSVRHQSYARNQTKLGKPDLE